MNKNETYLSMFQEQETLRSSTMNVDLFIQKVNSFQKEHMVQLHELKEANLKWVGFGIVTFKVRRKYLFGKSFFDILLRLNDEAAKIRDRDSKIDTLNEMILSERIMKAREEENVKKLGRKLALVVQVDNNQLLPHRSFHHPLP